MAELIVVILVIAVLAALLLPALARQREEARRARCRENLRLLAHALNSYCIDTESWRSYPVPLAQGQQRGTYNGAEWLAGLYWTGSWRPWLPDPDVFLCPSSGDTNAKGKDIGCRKANDCGGTFGSQTISYAGMWWKSVNTQSGGRIDDSFLLPDLPPSNEPMVCDDTQGGINHGSATNGGMNILFFDSHVEFKTAAEVDITSEHGSVGQGFPNPPKTLLWRLKN